MNRKVRVRFAPSPTGPLHIGGVRTALFNYLFARHHNGSFILRIEDTDQNRYVPGAEQYIIESLKWCGMFYDEGVDKGGAFAPYRQSERKDIYSNYAFELIKNGSAYYAFDTPDELEAMRERLIAQKSDNQQYNAATRSSMKNSLTLSEAEVQDRLKSGEPYVIRFKMPDNEELEVIDIIRGKVCFNTALLDDKVLYKSDGMPTYHLANIVDDHLMEISHVIRGEEWLPSLPLHVLLYRSFGWLDTMPEFAHLPLLLKPDGKGKLSKRDGDQMGFPVFPLEWSDPKTGEISMGYRESGYFVEAFVNMLALLGWNPGTEQEIFSLNELVAAFSLERAGKSGSKFDPEKAKWFNHQYLQHKTNTELAGLFEPLLQQKGISESLDKIAKICGLVKERANFVSEIWDHSYYFFIAPEKYDQNTVKKQWKNESPEIMSAIRNIICHTEPFDALILETDIKAYLEANQMGMGKVMNPLRLLLVGTGFGVHLFDIMEVIGKNETLKRIDKGLNTL